jgi:hypothetical protein
MNVLTGLGSLLLVGALAAPAGASFVLERTVESDAASSQLMARAGGGGGRGGGGTRGGGSRGGGSRGHTGFSSAAGGLNRGSTRPTGGWSNKVGADRARPSMDRPAANRTLNRDRSLDLNRDLNRDGNRNISRDVNRDINRSVNRDINRTIDRNWNVDRNWGRNIDIGDVDLYPGWARPGWGVARPWNYGWYGGWATPTWGWWGARAAAWGVGALATAAVINDAVDDAVDDHVSYIVVPNTDYQLLYGTVQPSSSSSVTFDVTANGSSYRLTADCQSGYLNGREPSTANEAELLNAACQVAYGSA